MESLRTELPSTTARLGILDGRATIPQIAEDVGRCERATRNTLDRLAVPFVVAFRQRYYLIEDVRRALLGEPGDRTPRRRGRPPGRSNARPETATAA